MRKIMLKILVCVFIVLEFIGCSNKKLYNTENISLEVKNDTLTNKGATFILKNNTSILYNYGESYYIEKEKNNEWYKLETINELSFILIGYNLKSHESKEIDIDWEYGYGKLETGKYRLVKSVFKELDIPIDENKNIYIFAEFEI